MRISELAQAAGLSVHRIRRYADAGLLLATRGHGNYRVFDTQAVRDARFIAMGRDIGFSLPELTELLPLYRQRALTIDDMVERLQKRIAAVDQLIEEQQVLRARLVEHIDWFELRRTRLRPATNSSPFPSAPTRRTQP